MQPTVRFFIFVLLGTFIVPFQYSYGAKKLKINVNIKRKFLPKKSMRVDDFFFEEVFVKQEPWDFISEDTELSSENCLLTPDEKPEIKAFCCLSEITTLISLLGYGLKIIDDSSHIEQLRLLEEKIYRFLPETDSFKFDKIKSDLFVVRRELALVIRELARKLELSTDLFFHEIQKGDSEKAFCYAMFSFVPFIIYFLEYCLAQEPGNLFVKNQSVFDEKSSDYINIAYIIWLLENRITVYGEHVSEFGDLITAEGAEVNRSLDGCNLMVQITGKAILAQIKKRHKKVSELANLDVQEGIEEQEEIGETEEKVGGLHRVKKVDFDDESLEANGSGGEISGDDDFCVETQSEPSFCGMPLSFCCLPFKSLKDSIGFLA